MAVTKVLASGDANVAGVKINDIVVVGEQIALSAALNAAVNATGVAANANVSNTVVETTEFNALVVKHNALLAAMKTHGLIASS